MLLLLSSILKQIEENYLKPSIYSKKYDPLWNQHFTKLKSLIDSHNNQEIIKHLDQGIHIFGKRNDNLNWYKVSLSKIRSHYVADNVNDINKRLNDLITSFDKPLAEIESIYETSGCRAVINEKISDENFGKLGVSRLFSAIEKNDINIVKWLLQKNAFLDIHEPNPDLNALTLALKNKNYKIIALLLDHVIKQDEESIIGWMKQSNISDAEIGSGNYTLLHYFAEKGMAEAVDFLISMGADPNIQNSQGFTPLYLAVACERGQTVKLLLEKNADPNIRDCEGRTPLYRVGKHRYPQITELLIQNNAELNILDNSGLSPLD